MATHLDSEEQDQIEQLKCFWKRYGMLLTWLLIAALALFGGWNGWQWWQRDQAMKASVMFDELDMAAQKGDVDIAARVFDDMKARYAGVAFTQQGGLMLAKAQLEKGQTDSALAALVWVSANAIESEYKTLARLRAAGLLLDQKKYDEALAQLDGVKNSKEFDALVADRRGDVLQARGQTEEAKAAYTQAWAAMSVQTDYRRLIEAKLSVLGAAPVEPVVKVVEAKAP
jgi:predicted negative regulator of RcsB-dependent stress response